MQEPERSRYEDETRLLLADAHDSGAQEDHDNEEIAKPSLSKGGLSILLLGVFLVNSDSAVQFTLFRSIASEFGELQSASWIVNSYMMGVLVFMPLCGKLSDIFGRMPILAAMYGCYAIGAFLSGLGLAWWSMLLGRAIAGISNGGIGVLVSILVVDVLPIRDVALWRSYVYLVNQLGRVAGPPLGGLMADAFSWRWAIIYQVPFHLFSLFFVTWTMLKNRSRDPKKPVSSWESSKFQRVDYFGSLAIAIANVAMLLFMDKLSKVSDLRRDVSGITFLAIWLSFMAAFFLIEAFWAPEPILPLGLYMKPNVVAANIIQFMQTAAQVSLYSTIPLYLRIIGRGSSLAIAGTFILITLGVIIGGTLSGFVIKKTGRYRPLLWISLIISTASYLVIFLRWRGSTHLAESLYGMGAGFGFGVSISASFICLNVGLDPSEFAVATSGFYLSLNTGSIVGLAIASLLITNGVRTLLEDWLAGIPGASRIIHDVTSDLSAIKKLSEGTRALVSAAYIQAITNVWLLGFVCGGLALLSSFLIPSGRLDEAQERQPSRTYNTFQQEAAPESDDAT